MKFLIVDDNHDLADLIGIIFSDEGCEVDVVYTQAEAMQRIQNDYDFALIDAKLSDGNGLDVFRRFEQNHGPDRSLIVTAFRLDQMIAESAPEVNVKLLRQVNDETLLCDLVDKLESPSFIVALFQSGDAMQSFGEALKQKGYHVSVNPGLVVDSWLEEKPRQVFLQEAQDNMIRYLFSYLEAREKGSIPASYVLMIDASNLGPGEDAFTDAEITGCVFKPFDVNKLIETVNQFLRKSRD